MAMPTRPAHAQPDLLHITRDKLTLNKKKVGSGGFGDVYHAVWRDTDDVAVKKLRVELMSADVLDEFYREVSFLHALPYHANVLQIHGVCVDEDTGTYLMVTEWMAGGSLYHFLKSSAAGPQSNRHVHPGGDGHPTSARHAPTRAAPRHQVAQFSHRQTWQRQSG